jgi:glycerol-3-phosphate dehydrogenase
MSTPHIAQSERELLMKLLAKLAIVLALGTVAVVPGVVAAKPPVYKAAGPNGGLGYTNTKVEENRYVITYTGDARMKADVVANYALLRAAEFTTEAGHEWFAVLTTSVKEIEVGSAEDVASRTGAFIGNVTASSGAGSNQSAGSDSSIPMGPSTGGFGGGDVPPAVLERWKPRKVSQAVLLIQVGSGDQASFPGATKQPEIFEAKKTAEEIRASVK